MKKTIEELREEENLFFNCFNYEDAWKLGTLAVTLAKDRNLPIVINIEKSGQILFHAAMKGTSVDNDFWIEGKRNIVKYFAKSSLLVSRMLELEQKNVEKHFFLDPGKYRAKGGAFPINIKGSGMVGVITVSGMKDDEDHDFVVEVLRKYI